MSVTDPAKRFYEQTGTKHIEGGFTVTLDNRFVKTPSGGDLVVPGEALAQAIANEWDAQEEVIKPHSMPMMQLTCTALDRISKEREAIVERISSYAGSDLICYLADGPDDLVRLQRATWQPLLDWAHETYELDLKVTSGITYVDQTDKTMQAAKNIFVTLNDYDVTVLAELIQVTGSFVIGLAVFAKRLTPEAAFEASQLDESWQIERWGEDEEATLRRDTVLFDIRAAANFIELLSS